MNVKALLANRTFLYVVLGVSVASLFGYLVGQRTNAVLFFLLTGYVTSHFTKNMSVILLVPLLLTNFVFSFNRMREGLESKKDAATAKRESRTPTDSELAEAEGDDGDGGAAPAPVDIGAKMAGHEDDVSEDAGTAPKANKNNKRGGNNRVNGASTNSNSDNAAVQPHPEVDKKKTKDMAFSYIESVLGDDGINQMSAGMSDMVEKHEKLQKMIETMSPIIDKASGLLDKVNGADFGSIENMVKKMSGMIGNVL